MVVKIKKNKDDKRDSDFMNVPLNEYNENASVSAKSGKSKSRNFKIKNNVKEQRASHQLIRLKGRSRDTSTNKASDGVLQPTNAFEDFIRKSNKKYADMIRQTHNTDHKNKSVQELLDKPVFFRANKNTKQTEAKKAAFKDKREEMI